MSSNQTGCVHIFTIFNEEIATMLAGKLKKTILGQLRAAHINLVS